MCIAPKFIIDWFMIMVLLVLKLLYLVTLWTLKVSYAFMFFFHEGQVEYHFAMFYLCSKQTNNFQCIIIHDLLFVLHFML
jgi:hypothetical protein